ncbi:polyribonucleotide nucleotidyltransferase, partial [candidate division WWE3 bacterium]|nr:polyribonucleotide nucleotidyltransferase [candidate division WWE3 bacterium]
RLIDHAIRPLFPNDYMDEVQIVATVLSADETADPEFLAMVATSAALGASDIPWNGPMLTTKVGYIKDKYVLNPSRELIEAESDLDLVVSFCGAEKKFLALEAGVNLLSEEKVLGAIEFARENVDPLYQLLTDFVNEVNPKNEKYEYVSKALSEDLLNDVAALAKEKIAEIMRLELDKTLLKEKQDEMTTDVLTKLEGKYKKVDMLRAISELEKKSIQHMILDEEKRPDGRGIKDIRKLSASVGILPRTHGSALFTRGVTQVLTVATLGSPSMELIIQDMYGEDKKRFLHYYNFPPFASGEVGKMGSPKSRDIGHGMLAEKALRPVIPDQKDFPYTIMLVSETLSSSGSSSMASASASTLALMDAGVPIKGMVGGIGVGLIVNDDFSKYKIMTDLAYMEDAYGFLDFKMTGTRDGVTAIQSDMKLPGIPMELLPKIFEQSKEGRMKVLDVMEGTINKPNASVSQYAPKMVSFKINPDKIGMVIGSGGRTIKDIQEKTSSEVYIEDDGSIVVSAESMENANKAAEIIQGMTHEVEIGEVYEGTVVDILDFGALVEILPGKVGLMHVSEISSEYVKSVEDFFKVGDKVTVKVIATSDDGKISLSKRAMDPGYVPTERAPRNDRRPGGNRRR